MGRTIEPEKKKYAHLLYMQGELQKDICERVGLNARTLQKMIEEGNWAEMRAAKTVTRTELTNKTLNAIATLLDRIADKEEDAKELKGIPDQLSKLVSNLKTLDKGSNVVDDMDTFMNFNNWLRQRMTLDKSVTIDIVKTINRLQDTFVNEKLAQK